MRPLLLALLLAVGCHAPPPPPPPPPAPPSGSVQAGFRLEATTIGAAARRYGDRQRDARPR